MNWIRITWEEFHDEGESFSYPKEDLPKDVLLICKFNSKAGTYFDEMVYAENEEGCYVLQEVASKYWNVHQQQWILEPEWEDDYFPVAYTLYPDLLNND
jgi:hypothetical protein